MRNSTIQDDSSSTIPDDDDPWAYRSLSASQKTILAILPIPSAILSIIGSSVIIYMAYLSKKSRPWTPYNRLLVVMSVYDIITSLTLGSAAFMNNKDTSTKAWAMGNDSTCSLVGFLNQISYSGTLYNAALSHYFLFTARFGMKNDRIAQRIEPKMHVFNVGFPTLTAFVGLFLGVYSESETNLGCWVNRYPERCAYGPDGTGEPCLSGMIGWIFGAWIGLFTLLSLIVNNFVIWYFARRQIKKRGISSHTQSKATSVIEVDEDTNSVSQTSMASSFRTGVARSNDRSSSSFASMTMDEDIRRSQQKRLRLISSQAFLFVASYLVCNFVSYLFRYIENQATSWVQEMELPLQYYILMVLQAILLPLQGLFNMLVYIRPKYLKSRSDFSRESRMWAFRRAIWGAKVEPIHLLHEAIDIKGGNKGNRNAHQQDMISSLTNASGGDVDDEYETDRSSLSFRRKPSGASNRRSTNSLEVISETAELEEENLENNGDQKIESGEKRFSNHSGSGSAAILMDGSIVSI